MKKEWNAMTLYEINNTINSVIENGFKMDEDTGEVLFTSEDLEKLQLDRQAKIESIALYIKNKEVLASDIEEEIKNLTERKKAVERKIQSLKDYIRYILNGEKFESAKCAISYRRSTKIEIDDIEQVPEDYIRLEVNKSANKSAIKKAMNEGKEIAGCHIEEYNNMTIK